MERNKPDDTTPILARLRRYLAELSSDPAEADPEFVEEANLLETTDLSVLVAMAGEESQRRALRRRHLPAELLGEPAWDILLDIFANRAVGKRVSFKSTCLATGVPASEAVRWVNLLEAEDLLFHRRDAKDPCCLWLDLTDLGMERMCAHFREIRADRPL